MGGAWCPEGLVPIRNERGTPATGLGRRCLGNMDATTRVEALFGEGRCWIWPARIKRKTSSRKAQEVGILSLSRLGM